MSPMLDELRSIYPSLPETKQGRLKILVEKYKKQSISEDTFEMLAEVFIRVANQATQTKAAKAA